MDDGRAASLIEVPPQALRELIVLAPSNDAVNPALGGFSKKVYARSVPVIVEVRPLNGIGRAVGIKQSDAFTCWISNARIDQSCGCRVKAFA